MLTGAELLLAGAELPPGGELVATPAQAQQLLLEEQCLSSETEAWPRRLLHVVAEHL